MFLKFQNTAAVLRLSIVATGIGLLTPQAMLSQYCATKTIAGGRCMHPGAACDEGGGKGQCTNLSDGECECVVLSAATIDFVIVTGSDDLRADSSATATLQATDGSTQVLTLKAQGDAGWDNGSIHTVSFNLPNPLPAFSLSSITITLTSQTDDNWNVQSVGFTVTNKRGARGPTLNASGNPLLRLTGQQPNLPLPLPSIFLGPACSPPAAGCASITTYHNDSQRTGWNPVEPVLNPANVNQTSFGPVATAPLDDQVDTQPLFINGVLYVTTENNTVYALNYSTGNTVIRNLGTPVPRPLSLRCNGPVLVTSG